MKNNLFVVLFVTIFLTTFSPNLYADSSEYKNIIQKSIESLDETVAMYNKMANLGLRDANQETIMLCLTADLLQQTLKLNDVESSEKIFRNIDEIGG